MSGHQRDDKEFYLNQYKKHLREKRRLQELWKHQAMRRSVTTAAEAEMLEQRTKSYDVKIEEIEDILQHVDTEYPAFVEYYQHQKQLIQKSEDAKEKKKADNERELSEKKAKLDQFYSQERQVKRQDRHLKYHMARDWEYLKKVDESMPSYMRENLSRMPNNKGYIWRGVQYFGHLPSEPHVTLDQWTLFERKGNKQYIHEIFYGRYHRIYEKEHKTKPKVLIQDLPCPRRM